MSVFVGGFGLRLPWTAATCILVCSAKLHLKIFLLFSIILFVMNVKGKFIHPFPVRPGIFLNVIVKAYELMCYEAAVSGVCTYFSRHNILNFVWQVLALSHPSLLEQDVSSFSCPPLISKQAVMFLPNFLTFLFLVFLLYYVGLFKNTVLKVVVCIQKYVAT